MRRRGVWCLWKRKRDGMPRVKREGEKNEEAQTRDSGFVRGEGGEKHEVERRGNGIDEETRGCGDGDARGR